MRTKRISGIALSALAAASLNLAATAPAGAATEATNSCKTHNIVVKSIEKQTKRWSVYGDLYNGAGKHVHHWEAPGKKGKGEVRWRFKYCGDGGWAHVWLHTPSRSEPVPFLNLALDRSHCWIILSGAGVAGDILECWE